MNVTLQLTIFAVLAVVWVALWSYRKWLEGHGDHYIHLHNGSSDTRVIGSQMTVARRIDLIERISRYVLIVLIAYGLALAAITGYNSWNAV